MKRKPEIQLNSVALHLGNGEGDELEWIEHSKWDLKCNLILFCRHVTILEDLFYWGRQRENGTDTHHTVGMWIRSQSALRRKKERERERRPFLHLPRKAIDAVSNQRRSLIYHGGERQQGQEKGKREEEACMDMYVSSGNTDVVSVDTALLVIYIALVDFSFSLSLSPSFFLSLSSADGVCLSLTTGNLSRRKEKCRRRIVEWRLPVHSNK